METRLITEDRWLHEFDRLVERDPVASAYNRRSYIEFIADWLDADAVFLGAIEERKLVGAFPLVLKENSLGNVINSSPYFGSYGGIVLSPKLNPETKREVRRGLLDEFTWFAEENDTVLSNVIVSPYETDPYFYEDTIDYTYLDERAGQIIDIPSPTADENVKKRLFSDRFSKSCRRSVRDAKESDVTVGLTREAGERLDQFYEIYKGEMLGKGYDDAVVRSGGGLKDKEYFERLFDIFGDDAQLRYVTLNDDVIMGIVELCHGEKLQYYQPAIEMKHRNTGATNLGVYESLQWAVENGYSKYNFGGTWFSQTGLYNFKRRFGADDYIYRYYVTEHRNATHILELTPEELSEEYPGFYVVPYDELEN
ncbi:peptidoglycan bridge formation glycyltransferase FemA/FemB family protein [Halobellus captivus]|uniref:peptidoglycan bridge formation glycyltransferase FemA/FemB family protein n=1 Tax=Halobellus captivus TaxID=2592614 RepID=UPI00119EA5C4|nr:peptidoglycan bridge formation glycyltransferase FemA/FemB family protein [Halobellus captivus]